MLWLFGLCTNIRFCTKINSFAQKFKSLKNKDSLLFFMEWKPRNKPRLYSIKNIKLKNGVTIGIFQGSKGQRPELDMVIKYLDPSKSSKVRTPKHIHWVIDLLIKKEHSKALTMDFISYLRSMWDTLEPLKTKNEQLNVDQKLTPNKDLARFEDLNIYGEYSVEFIAYITELFVIEEKTGMEDAHVFKELFDALLAEKDIFYVVSKATQIGH